MKKLLHVALVLLLSFTSMLNAENIDEKSLSKLMDLSGITKQMQEYPDLVKSGINTRVWYVR